MRAVQFAQYGPPSVLEVVEVAEPHAGPGEVRVAVRASGLSTGETLIRSGAMRAVVPAVLPWRTGFDAAGVVDEVGAGVTGVAIGDAVFGWVSPGTRGANAEIAVLVAWAPKPAGWSWDEAGGAAGSVETATRVLDRLAVGDGDTVLINGAAGGVGTVAVQLAVARGARVVGTAGVYNHEFLRALGAHPTTYGPGLTERVPPGVDAVFDCAGGALPDLIALAGDPDRVVTIADLTAPAVGVHLSSGGTDPLADHALGLAVDLAAQGRLTIPVAATFGLEEAAAAHELSEGRHAPGKIVFSGSYPPAPSPRS
ncbi:NADP-dependent oxidoreductase [Cryptosporangium arvum]|uniref:Zn-dependent oxidoreductase, NADPH:quinone reductase n=1 Tax=Cryptosporangium arvum DSM 44712 TaxID=927661 RepID=A0A010YP37_9ACTN|nr:NADP-dependent oxidoreductase [Cryptosporangium arvum]EXG81945.1 Zn-dependent oxidoreductase, NADPH:quinone reductase [Cryptosporangium arvum DSM 44712]